MQRYVIAIVIAMLMGGCADVAYKYQRTVWGMGVFPFFRSRGETRGEPELKAQQR